MHVLWHQEVSVEICASSFSHSCDEIPGKSIIRKDSLFWLLVQGCGPLWQGRKNEGAQGSWSHCTVVRKQRDKHWNSDKRDFSHLSKLSIEIPSQTWLVSCLLGSSKFCQVDSINNHSPSLLSTSCVVRCKCLNLSDPPPVPQLYHISLGCRKS